MQDLKLPTIEHWGHETPEIHPEELAKRLLDEAIAAKNSYNVLPDGPEPCGKQPGFFRVSTKIPISSSLYDQLMNGATGYRAHYAVSIEMGEAFNNQLVRALAPVIEEAEFLYADLFSRDLCRSSLFGRFTKIWYSTELTDPSALPYLDGLPEEISFKRWSEYWSGKQKPRKGLLAPLPADTSILLNGTFVDPDTEHDYEQKPGRSNQIYEQGWT